MSLRKNLIVLFLLGLALLALAGCAAPTPTATPVPPTAPPPTAAASATSMTMPSGETMKPNCSGGTCDQPGPAITQNLKGDPAAGAKVFADNCEKCHGNQGKGGVENPGSNDGTMPSLNPVDEDMGRGNPQLFATTLDLFIEHGSTPDGPNPKNVMDSWGDSGKLTPQQIADVISYIVSLNP